MAALAINDQEAEVLGQNIVQSSSTINGYLNEIGTINSDIAAAWQGTDASTYCERINTQLEEMRRIKNTIEETGIYLQNVAKAYRQVREDNSNYTA